MEGDNVQRSKTEDKYPYYVIPDIEALASERDNERLRMHRRRIAACIGDPDALRAILGDASEDFQDFYGTSDLPTLSTADAIDSFIEKFGPSAEDRPADEEPVVPVDAPVIDYAAMLEQEAPEDAIGDLAADATLGAIDAFLSKQPAPRIRPKKETKEPEKPSLTESFAKIMIKNGNYSRALEIITEISLNNPEKSIYFADQIRFLKKVISL
ncbi:MAG: hypothetical protein K2N48_14670, partial [Muribaculaceae bacterium]|nr:hypothetical protein [Muribaculaceae bacterium]